jgi:DNA-binding MarR family transcriptional regulator
MGETSELKGHSLLQIAERRYNILYSLYPDEEFYLNQLAEKIGVDEGNLSRYIRVLDEAGLVQTRDAPVYKGMPRKYIRLTHIGKRILALAIEAYVTPSEDYEPADPAEIEFYFKMMGPDENEGVRQIASEELVILCRDYDVTSNDSILLSLKEKMEDSEYKHILLNLLHALLGIIRNTGNEETHKRIRSNLKKTLKDLIGQPSETSPEREGQIRYTSLEVLTALSDGEETYTELVGLLRSLIEEAAPFAHDARRLILSKHPDKKNEMRRTLFKMLANPDEDLKRRVEDHIRELRKYPLDSNHEHTTRRSVAR